MVVVKQVGQNFDGETPLAFEKMIWKTNDLRSGGTLELPMQNICLFAVGLPPTLRLSVASARLRPFVRCERKYYDDRGGIPSATRCDRFARMPRPSVPSITRPVYHCSSCCCRLQENGCPFEAETDTRCEERKDKVGANKTENIEICLQLHTQGRA